MGIMGPSSRDNFQLVKTIYGEFFSWRDDVITEQLLTYSAHTRNELAMVLSFLKSGHNVIDVGAHIGTYAIPFAKRIGPRGSVIAFEGNTDNFELLTMNIQQNGLGSRIIPVNCVINDSPVSTSMYLPEGANSGMYYFLPQPGLSTEPAVGIDSWLEENKYPGKIDLLKVDTEGAEAAVLRSASRLIERDRPMIYLEINTEALARFLITTDDLQELFDTWGYRLFRNVGERNSANDAFTVEQIAHLDEGGFFFDVLALPPETAPLRSGLLQRIIRAARSRLP
jgi:FkbM family methyltransferase